MQLRADFLALGLWACVSLPGFHPMEASAQAPPNVALHQPVYSSGENWGSFKPAALTDGDPATFTHPLAATGTLGFYYEVDLGVTRRIDRVVLRNRSDGCCTDRLSRFRVEVWSDGGGSAGVRNWNASIRKDGSSSGVGGVDTITGDMDAAGAFAGRFVRVVNDSGAEYNPQLAEIEVYGGIPPTIRQFTVDEDILDAGQSTLLRWSVTNATAAFLSPEPGKVDAVRGSWGIAPTTTTVYTLQATNENGVATASVTVGVGLALLPPDLTEFSANNGGAPKDRDGDASDWLELRNPNPYSLRVGGFHLTDDAAEPSKWTLPDVRIPAGGYLIVFASGKDRRDPRGELHTNFKLSANGDYVALVDRDGKTVLRAYPADVSVAREFPRQLPGASYGVGADGRIGFLRPVTPGATNGLAYSGVVEDVRFSQERGIQDAAFQVELSTPTAGATIRYTTDRSAPTATKGTVYGGPISVTRTTVLRAAAFKDEWAPTEVATHTYLFPADILASSVMRKTVTTNATYGPKLPAALREIPSISMVTSAAVGDTVEVGISMEWLPADGTASVQANCGARLFGGAYTDFAKKSFRLYFRGAYGTPKLKAPLFRGFEQGFTAAEEFDQVELRSGSHDMAMRGFYLSNIFTDDTLLELGQLNPHGRFVHLYLNGTYWGVYHLRERWGAAMHASYLGGAQEDYESINGNWNVGGWADPGTVYDGDGTTWARLKSVRRDYSKARLWLDVPEYVDYMVMWMFGGSEDEYRCVGPAVAGSGFKFYLNDADGWFCIPQYCAANDRTTRGAPGRQAGDGPGSVFSMLFAGADPEYRILLADRIQRALFNGGALSPQRNADRLRRRTTEIERPFLAESARWGYLTPTEWASRRDSAMTWLPKRTTEVSKQFRTAGFLPLPDAPVMNQQGGVTTNGFALRFTGAAANVVWFTTDGTDPRLPGGAVSTAARSHRPGLDDPLILTGNTVITSRTRTGSAWSAMNEAFFQTGEEPVKREQVLFSEISPRPLLGEGVEFVELLNVATESVNLRGAHFEDGVGFAFADNRDLLLAPGQRVVLVNDLYAFRQRYGLDVPVAGVFSGHLSSSGERLLLTSREGATLATTAYGTSAPWPEIASAGGHTLVLAFPELGALTPEAWRLSAGTNGSPATSDATAFQGDPDADVDGDGFPALVEHALGSRDDDPTSGPGSIRAGLAREGWFTLTLTRNLSADDVLLRVEESSDLRSWSAAILLSSVALPDGMAREEWGSTSAGRSQVYLRLQAIRRR